MRRRRRGWERRRDHKELRGDGGSIGRRCEVLWHEQEIVHYARACWWSWHGHVHRDESNSDPEAPRGNRVDAADNLSRCEGRFTLTIETVMHNGRLIQSHGERRILIVSDHDHRCREHSWRRHI